MRATVRIDATQLLLKLRNPAKRIAFTLQDAVNRTMDRIQVAEVQRGESQLTIRTTFARRQLAIIKPRARAKHGQLSSTISIGQRKRLFLSMLERGGERFQQRAAVGKLKGVAVALTGGARPSESQVIPSELWVSKLRLRRKGRRGAGEARYVGELGTYTVPGVGIFQRRAGQVESALLYADIENQRLPKLERGFIETADGVQRRWFPIELRVAVLSTLTRAR